MAKAKIGQKETVGVIVFVLLMIVAIFASVSFLITRSTGAPSASSRENSVKGEAVCLPRKNQGDVQTMECALGIKADSGSYYSLSDSTTSYANVSQLQTGKRYQVYGNIEERADPVYQTLGTIRVTNVKAL